MSSLSSRLAKLEAEQPAEVKQYYCSYREGEESAGFDVVEFGGKNPQHFATLEELQAFEARPDVDLLCIVIVYASQAAA